jgi:hypothetical protein
VVPERGKRRTGQPREPLPEKIQDLRLYLRLISLLQAVSLARLGNERREREVYDIMGK